MGRRDREHRIAVREGREAPIRNTSTREFKKNVVMLLCSKCGHMVMPSLAEKHRKECH